MGIRAKREPLSPLYDLRILNPTACILTTASAGTSGASDTNQRAPSSILIN